MATGDVTIWTGTTSTGNVSFQPSSGVQMTLKCCSGQYLSGTNYIMLTNQSGYNIRGDNVSSPQLNSLNCGSGPWGTGDQVEWFSNQLMTNAKYVVIDGVGSSSKGYYAAGIQTDA